MLYRTISDYINTAAKTFPAIVLTGPRQSGKTTLLKHLFGRTHTYLSLENPDVRQRILGDPVSFIKSTTQGVILDEIQQLPELFSYIKTSIDEDRVAGKWILTGSQNLSLMQSVSESLAGRSAVLSLLPFSFSEAVGQGDSTTQVKYLFTPNAIQKKPQIAEVPTYIPHMIWRGSYPEISTHPSIDRNLWLGSYVNTYLERDVRNLYQVGDLRQYETFLRACALRTGQILDVSQLAKDVGISFTTAKRWLSLLETGYQILLLQPYYQNLGKRLTKRAKLYFIDTGVASFLMGFNSVEDLERSTLYGALFETFIVADMYKRFVHHGEIPSMYYIRTQDGLEVDLAIEQSQKLSLMEIKSSRTITPGHASSLLDLKRAWGDKITDMMVVSQSETDLPIAPGVVHMQAIKFLSI